jgi:hypothetical protein
MSFSYQILYLDILHYLQLECSVHLTQGQNLAVFVDEEIGIPESCLCHNLSQNLRQSYTPTGSQSASLFWWVAPTWDPCPIFLLLSLIILFFVEVEVNSRPMVRWPACLGVRLPSGAHEQIFVLDLTIAGFLDFQVGELKIETINYAHESRGTQT